MAAYRGRLIWPFRADVRRLDTVSMAAETGAVPGLASGFDPDFREPVKLPSNDEEGPGVTNRKEFPQLLIPCQVEVGSYDRRQQSSGGNVPKGRVTCVFHYRDLEALQLVDDDGVPFLRVSDRLAAIYDQAGGITQSFEEVPLYASEVQPSGWGLSGLRRNLLVVHFDPRDKGGTT